MIIHTLYEYAEFWVMPSSATGFGCIRTRGCLQMTEGNPQEVRNKREPPAALKKHRHKEARGVIFYLGP